MNILQRKDSKFFLEKGWRLRGKKAFRIYLNLYLRLFSHRLTVAEGWFITVIANGVLGVRVEKKAAETRRQKWRPQEAKSKFNMYLWYRAKGLPVTVLFLCFFHPTKNLLIEIITQPQNKSTLTWRKDWEKTIRRKFSAWLGPTFPNRIYFIFSLVSFFSSNFGITSCWLQAMVN